MKDIGQGMRWLFRLPLRMLSLRTIVIVAALGVVTTVIIIGTWVWVGITNDQYSQLDRRLDSLAASATSAICSAAHSAPGTTSRATAIWCGRSGWADDVSVPRISCCPNWPTATPTPPSTAWTTACGPSRGPAAIALGAPVAETQRRIANCTWRVLLSAAG